MKKSSFIGIIALGMIGVVSCLGIIFMLLKNDHPDSQKRTKDNHMTVESHSCESIQERGILKVGVKNFSWAWFQEPGKTTENDPWYGWESEYVKRFAEAMNVQVQYVKFDDGMTQFEALKKGQVDMAMTSGLIETYNIHDEYTTSIPYNDWGIENFPIVLRKDDYSTYNSLERLKKAKIGVIDDSSLIESTKKIFPNATLEIKDLYTLYEQLENKELDACVIYMAHYDEVSEFYKEFQLSTISVPIQSQGMGVFLMKGNESLKTIIDQEIQEINEQNLGATWSDKYYLLAKEWQIAGVD